MNKLATKIWFRVDERDWRLFYSTPSGISGPLQRTPFFDILYRARVYLDCIILKGIRDYTEYGWTAARIVMVLPFLILYLMLIIAWTEM